GGTLTATNLVINDHSTVSLSNGQTYLTNLTMSGYDSNYSINSGEVHLAGGTADILGGTMQLGGTFSVTNVGNNVGTFHVGGGNVNVTAGGLLSLTGSTLKMSSDTLNINGGELRLN